VSCDERRFISRITWEGNSQAEIRSWPKEIRADIGLELDRLDNHEAPLDSKSLGKGIQGLRDEDQDFCYRLLYALHAGRTYVLHCFAETTNKIPKADFDLALARFKAVKKRQDSPYPRPEVTEEEESA
jgi:phage-related protein